jgi:type II secretion system protein I
VKGRGGFTLLEVLVATVLMSVAVAGLLSQLTTSLNTAARLTEADRAALLARRKMDELMTVRRLPKGVPVEGAFEGASGGWRARVTPFEMVRGSGPGSSYLERIELEIWWMNGDRRRTFALEGFRRATLMPEDLAEGMVVPQ